jgi:hypothetical protein
MASGMTSVGQQKKDGMKLLGKGYNAQTPKDDDLTNNVAASNSVLDV